MKFSQVPFNETVLSGCPVTLLPVEPDEALSAVGLLRGLLEGAAVELLQAVGAHKVLRVELPMHGCDATTLCVWESPSP